MPALRLPTPVGVLSIVEDENALVAVRWGGDGDLRPSTRLLAAAADALERYFSGSPLDARLPLRPAGTALQLRVWERLRAIPHGETRSYGEIGRAVGTGARAAAAACARNPLPILIPCHRVIAADGRLTGYSGGDGLATKAALLRLEQDESAAATPAARPRRATNQEIAPC